MERLGQLPLAIDQAASYIQDRPLSTGHLYKLLLLSERSRKEILKHTQIDGEVLLRGDLKVEQSILRVGQPRTLRVKLELARALTH